MHAIEALSAHKKQQAEEHVKAGPAWENKGLIFCTGLGKELDPSAFSHLFKRIVTRAGIANVRLHDLRHTFSTLSLQAGTSIKAL